MNLLCSVFLFSANWQQSRPAAADSSRIGSNTSPADAVQYRLKPPVSAINMERKVIKLSGGRSTASSSVPNSHQSKPPAVSESNSVSTSCVNSSAGLSRKIRLSQPDDVSAIEKTKTVLSTSADTLPAKRTSVIDAEETEKKKFKATAITWP